METSATRNCSRCGRELVPDAQFCSQCGEPVEAPVGFRSYRVERSGVYEEASPRSRLIALLLCAFLGYLGVHRFYVGKIGTGVLWVLTGGLAGVGWLIDLIMICTGGFRDSEGLPLIFWDESWSP